MPLIHPTYKFVDSAFGGLKRRNRVIELENLRLPADPVESYRTALRFDEAYLAHYSANNNSVRGYRGRACADNIFFDLDSPDLSVSHSRGCNFLRHLDQQYDVPLDAISIYFSGCKGFHIELPATLLGGIEPSKDLPQRIKNFVLSFGDWHFDERIYNHNRLWRITNSKNSKSGLYKIRLTAAEMFYLSIEEIKEKAAAPVPLDKFAVADEWSPIPSLVDLWHKPRPPRRTWVEASKVAELKDLTFLRLGVAEGERNNTLFIHAKRLRALGYVLAKSESLLSDWNLKNIPPLEENELLGTINSVYSYQGKPLDPLNILDSLQSSLLYQDLNAAQRDVLITLLSRARKVPENYIDGQGNKYHLEPGDLPFSFSEFEADCAKDVREASVRSSIGRLREAGWVELITLGGKRLSMIRIIGFNTHVKP
ncbi:MAG: primase alpha helix C-terminal domain-containing protein [Candidatus Marinimicrobia bacterium]|nr:primase alpha helix C-terminal domain-containing protein [Candidatus Neomarinimicrobiota bacterium]